METDARLHERYYYHSFPRRGRNSEVELENGLYILNSICFRGLYLTPEVIEWRYPHADNSPHRVLPFLQKRVCFTELSPSELPDHAQEFGRFALEFRADTLRALGGIPVSYIPAWNDLAAGAEALGHTLVCQLIDSHFLAHRIADADDLKNSPSLQRTELEFGFNDSQNIKKFDLDTNEMHKSIEAFTYSLTPPRMLANSLQALLSFFYPADDVRHNRPLHYYQQHEWRITGIINLRGNPLARELNMSEINQLCEHDSSFYYKKLKKPFEHLHFAKQVIAYSSFDSKRIIEFVNRVIVPPEALDQARYIVSGIAKHTPVIPISDLV